MTEHFVTRARPLEFEIVSPTGCIWATTRRKEHADVIACALSAMPRQRIADLIMGNEKPEAPIDPAETGAEGCAS